MLILAFSLPFLFIIAALIKTFSKGPVFFVQKRLGKNGKVFNCYKFRTMTINAEHVLIRFLEKNPALAEEWKANFKLKNDPRITGIGRFLRKTSLDELPQIINVMRGEMSLVGPRPRPLYELEGQENDFLFYLGLSALPGMTGLWQVYGRSDLDFKKRICLDAYYVMNWSLCFDITLLYRTVSIILRQKSSY